MICLAIAACAALAAETEASECSSNGFIVWGQSQCPCDCDRNGSVDVAELITGARVALGRSARRACDAADRNDNGRVTVDEVVSAVRVALTGCTMPPPVLDERIGVRVARISGDDASVRLTLRTERSYPCLGYRIGTALHITDGSIVAVLGCAFLPSICLTALGPAQFETELDLAAGTHVLELRAESDTDRYRVEVSPSDVRLEVIEASFSSVLE
jgi:hypothetical protein